MEIDTTNIEQIIDAALEQSADRIEVLKEIAEMEREPPEDDMLMLVRA